jgi:gliding motility-associated-like protein
MRIKLYTLVFIFAFAFVHAQISFMSYKSYPRADETENLCIVDINNDGRKDVILATGNSGIVADDYKLFLYLQNSSNTLDTVPVVYSYPHSSTVRSMACGDVNNDNLVDIVIGYGDSIGIYHQNSSGTLNPIIRYYGGPIVDGLKIGDLNNDGLADIAACHWNGTYMKIFYQNSSGIFTIKKYSKPTSGYDEIDIGDVNGDGLNDLVWVSQGHNGLNIFIQSGDTLLPYVTYLPPPHYSNTLAGIAIGDLNNDGRNDIAATRGGNTPNAWVDIWYQNSSTGLLNSPVEISAYEIPVPIEIADLNCDGKNEIVVGHTGWDNVSYYEQQANSTYGPYVLMPLSGNAQMSNCSMALGDISSDGKIDIATAVFDNGMNTLINKSAPPSFTRIDTLIKIDTLVYDTVKFSTTSVHSFYKTVAPYVVHEVDTLIKNFIYYSDSIRTDTIIIRKGFFCSGNYTDTLNFISYASSFYLFYSDTIIKRTFLDSALIGIIIPNVFSPNGDEINDVFYVKTTGIESITISIFNRWGKLIFETDKLGRGWAGTYNDTDAEVPDGTYYYIIKAKDVLGKMEEYKGFLHLLR